MTPRPLHTYETSLKRTEVQPRNLLMRLLGIPARVDEVEYLFTIRADRPVAMRIVEERDGELRPLVEPQEQGVFTHMQNPLLVVRERTRINY